MRFLFFCCLMFLISSVDAQEENWVVEQKEYKQKLENSYKALEGTFLSPDLSLQTLTLKDKKFILEENSVYCTGGSTKVIFNGEFSLHHSDLQLFPDTEFIRNTINSEYYEDQNGNLQEKILNQFTDTIRVNSDENMLIFDLNYTVYSYKNHIILFSKNESEFNQQLFAHTQNVELDTIDLYANLLRKSLEQDKDELVFKQYHDLYSKKDIVAEYREVFHYQDSINRHKLLGLELDYLKKTSDTLWQEIVQKNIPEFDMKEKFIFKLNKGIEDGVKEGHFFSNACLVMKITDVYENSSLAESIIGESNCDNNKVALKYLNKAFALGFMHHNNASYFDFENQKPPK